MIFLPRLFREKKESEARHAEMNTVVAAFHTLGGEIRSLKEQLIVKERLAALGEVSAGIAHEFRNSMSVIVGYARLLLKDLDETDQRREVVQGIVGEVEEMNRVMEELLKFSDRPIDKMDIDITKTIRDVVKSMGDAAQKIDFSFSRPVTVRGDEVLLRQAIKNLLQNAVDAGERVWINIEKESLTGRDGLFVIVKDNGRGIPKEDLNKIFMPFYTTKKRGTGIGLPLVQKIAMGHNGNISVKSREGRGSTFRLFLPAGE
ncbi:ATP-binding protein [Thermodesulfovibrionales bacterium]|nr:ATP-binding protein [Thermodesulfovibrionales bacterium]